MKKLMIFVLFLTLLSSSAYASDVTANSGSPQDIQIAVDQVNASGGGTVFIPEGDFAFNYVDSTGVNIPGGVNVIGMGSDKTVLNRTEIGGRMFYIDGSNGKSVRISGIHFFANVSPEETGSTPIVVYNTKDFRIDHNRFTNFPSGGGIASTKHTSIHRGVIDHNIFDNPYKEQSGSWQWSYGINLQITSSGRSAFSWKGLDYYLGNYDDNIVFIEDNVFSRCRYAVASNTGAWYVFRNNDVTVSPLYGSFGKAGVDVHEGSDTYWGGRGLESYNNTIRRGGDYGDQAFKLRGGSGVIHNNTIIDVGTAMWLLKADWATEEQNYVHEMYIWNNKYQNVGTQLSKSDFYQENVHYFLRAPNLVQDGFEYTPYPYPHPLTLGETPEPPMEEFNSILGRLVDKNNNPVQASVIAYQGETIINSIQTSDGNYDLQVPEGIYDIQFNLIDFYIPDYSIKLKSVNITNDTYNLIQSITGYQNENKVSIVLDVNDSQRIEIYNSEEPSKVKRNSTNIENVTSLAELRNNTWFFNLIEKKIIIIIDDSLISGLPEADYYVIESNSVYYAINGSDQQTLFNNTDAATVVNDVLNMMAAGQKVVFSGDFTIDSTVAVNKNNLYFDFSQATVNIAANTFPAFKVYGDYNTFYGGQYDPFADLPAPHSHWTGQISSSAIQLYSPNCVIDGFEFSGFTGATSVVTFSEGGSHNTIQNCYIHGGEAINGNTLVNILAGGYHSVINCKFEVYFTGVHGASGVHHNKVIGCEFYGWRVSGGHAIYFGGGDATNSGYNEIAYSHFHDGVNGAGCHIKCKNNSIHDNVFENLPIGAPAFSIYSELVGYTANDNDIFNNTLTNCYYGVKIGHGNNGASPTTGNLVHDNVFTSCTYAIILPSGTVTDGSRGCPTGESCPGPVIDTKIYYNDFHSCTNIFGDWGNFELTQNTVVAYNTFDAPVPDNPVLTRWTDTLSYGNEPWLVDYPYPLPPSLPVPPP